MNDLKDGESTTMQGSGKKPYTLKNIGGVFSCDCPSWRNQSLPIEKRTCKHLRKLRGDAAEEARIGASVPPSPAKEKPVKNVPPVLLAHVWDGIQDVKGWWCSEKCDGVRAYWDGKAFISRQGNVYHAPDWFIRDLPDHPLDGELWMGRKQFQETVSIVRRQDKSEHWKKIKYMMYDCPAIQEPFELRMVKLNSIRTEYALPLRQFECKGIDHLKEELAKIELLYGEGLMLRMPRSYYEAGRSMTLLKVKSFKDDEAVVLSYVPGKGKHKGKMGAIVCKLKSGKEFSVGTGFSDHQRSNPPPIGSTITFRYQELTNDNVPRFPSFIGMRDYLFS